jgi:homoserine kinase type II
VPGGRDTADQIEALAHAVSTAERPFLGQLPRQLLHGDFWHNNVLVRDGQPVAILDLDFMEEGPRIDDLALVLYYAYPSVQREHGAATAPQVLATLAQTYSEALEPAFSGVERSALPIAIARTCLHFTRHLSLRVGEAEQPVVEANLEELARGLDLVHELGRWQEAFAA